VDELDVAIHQQDKWRVEDPVPWHEQENDRVEMIPNMLGNGMNRNRLSCQTP
jgi:hypothetical protein